MAGGETRSNIFGQYLLYYNQTATNSQANDTHRTDAQAQVQAEIAAWPYAWLTNSDYPADTARGTVAAKFMISDVLKPWLTASTNTWIGVAQPDPGGNWQFESQRYQ